MGRSVSLGVLHSKCTEPAAQAHPRLPRVAKRLPGLQDVTRGGGQLAVLCMSQHVLHYFESSLKMIRLPMLQYQTIALRLRNAEDLLFERGRGLCHNSVIGSRRFASGTSLFHRSIDPNAMQQVICKVLPRPLLYHGRWRSAGFDKPHHCSSEPLG